MSQFETTGLFGKDLMDSGTKSLTVVTKGLQQVASETTEFTKASYEQSTKTLEQLFQSRSLDKVVELQIDYAKSAYQAWMSQTTKLGEIYSTMARESYKPFEQIIASAASKSTDAFRKAV